MYNTHFEGNSNQRAGDNQYKSIKIDKGCWIGANAVILPGVHVAEGCIISAGSIITKDCQANGLYGGVPARRLKELSNEM